MLHGGLRYLENGEFRLVREALHERNLLLRNAPHYARPLPTTIPVFKRFSGLWNAPLKFLNLLDRPAERGAIVIKIGLMLYDTYVRGESPMPGHYFLSRAKSLAEFPQINPRILCTANYYDGAMIPMERLCVELVLDAEAEGDHARALNYVSVVGAERHTVTLRDGVTAKTFTVKPHIVINAAGPWIDFANRALGHTTHFIGGTKGSHLVLAHPDLRRAIGNHGFFFENHDGRIVEINPFMDKVLVGTTDIRLDDPDEAICTDEEERYILSMISGVFPNIRVEHTQVVFRYAGVRPLPTTEASTTGQISRDHSIKIVEVGDGLEFPILSLIGGKWTTFRAFSEQAADAALARLGKPRQRSTGHLPIGGGRDFPTDQAAQMEWVARVSQATGLRVDHVLALLRRYGSRAEEVAGAVVGGFGDDKPLKNRPDYSHKEIAFLAQREKVICLDDLILRRTLMGLLGDTTLELVKELGTVIGHALDWPDARVKSEIKRAAEALENKSGIALN